MIEIYRLATTEDTEAVFELLKHAFAPIRELAIGFPAATATIKQVENNIKENACYILEENCQIIASITIRFPWGNTPIKLDIPYLCWFAVIPSKKNQGVGSKLLNWIEEVFLRDTLKVPAVSLATLDTHPWLIEMYERKGYQRFFEKEFGSNGTAVYMRKILIPHLFKG